jgi:hypothetical protein
MTRRYPSAEKKAALGLPSDFPLFPHSNGTWAKKISGKLRYFGRVKDDPRGEMALLKLSQQEGFYRSGMVSAIKPDAFLLNDSEIVMMFDKLKQPYKTKCKSPLCSNIVTRPDLFCCQLCFIEELAIRYGRSVFNCNGLRVDDIGPPEFVLTKVIHLLISRRVSNEKQSSTAE